MPAICVSIKDGHIPFPYKGETHQTYYKVFGDLEHRTRTPVVVLLHGGPGLSHDYMLPIADLADESYGYPVILYDQIGNARSTHLPDQPEDFWNVDLFLDELENLLRYFQIQDGYHIVGHSWGGMMASEFVVRRRPSGLQRLVIADSPTAIALWGQSFFELLQQYPQWVKDAIAKGFEDREAYWKALGEVYAVHGCRVQPMPKDLEYSLLQVYGEGADLTVENAPILKGWTIEDRLDQIRTPTLVINGKYDIAQDYVTRAYVEKIPGARWIRLEESSHTPHFEERDRYMKEVAAFLAG
ncbi:proline-specific peptidase [Dichomitus squalens LYAD-421 SS1]|uniref:Proline-specific peptidase n=2 Tax=Dichomitus squalens TaxID=114155 RepID=A0A4Q9PMR4_9APHY|nr:proline-specific peptidase [Dichomitus squalens LYAD-421 SS1]EJF61532.1 proline-specific peptidase [Dichomitus squalens LYAD-421 SS1]TBU55424.1 proline-specific peptidase [Dichomitus squalens]